MTAQSSADWAAIRAAYETGNEPVSAVAARFAVPVSTLRSRARRGRWLRGAPLTGHDLSSRHAEPVGRVKPPARRRRRKRAADLQQHLLEVLVMQVTRLEDRITREEPLTASDAEREARALHQLVKNFEALRSHAPSEGTAAAEAAKVEHEDGGATRDADGFREEIANRLDRLRAQLGERDERPGGGDRGLASR